MVTFPAKHSVPQNTYVLQAGGRTAYFGGDTLLIPELAEVARRFPQIDLVLLPINGLRVRPLLGRKIVMDPEDAAELCRILRPRIVVPIHYSFTGGPTGDRLLLGYAGSTADVCVRFGAAVAEVAPETVVRVLPPSEPLLLVAAAESRMVAGRVAV